MLACARLGAAHTVVFGGFSAEALSDRINDAPGQGPHHGRRWLAAGQGGRSQDRGGPRPPEHALDPGSARGRTDRQRGADGRRSGPLVARHRRSPVGRLPARPGRLGAAALPALHVGHDGQAQGHRPHQRGLSPPDELHPRDRVRRQARRRVLVRRGYRLGDRPQLHRVRPVGECFDRGHLRGCARHAGLGSLVADHRGLQDHDPVLRPDSDPRVHEAGRDATRPGTISRRSGCSARSASRSIPRPGCGTTRTSAAGGRPSSTPGGRPRPERSSSVRCPA